jgi:uncharacterized protein YndB with AHSA1/START domain
MIELKSGTQQVEKMPKTETKTKKGLLIITRTFDAPPGLVWKAFTDPALMGRWWGPKGYTAPVMKIDLRVGGKYLYCMRSSEGRDIWSTGVFREIVPYRKLVATDSFADEKGNVVMASHYGMTGEWPSELIATETFDEENGRTRFTLRHEDFPSAQDSEMARAGWNESFDKLDDVLRTEKERYGKNVIVAEPGPGVATLTRVLDAPPERILRAYTDPKLIPLWWGPARLTTKVEKMDATTGGSWRFIQHDTEGNEYAFRGVYHEVSPMRIVQTFEFEGMPGNVMLQVMTLEEHDGKTKMTDKSIIESADDMEGMLASGMMDGWSETVDRLAMLVEKQ